MRSAEFILVAAPLIKQTPDSLPAAFVRSTVVQGLNDSGLVSVVVSPDMSTEAIKKLYAVSSGIVFVGGSDWNAALYGQTAMPEAQISDEARDQTELELFEMAFNDGMPIFGLCRGEQGIAVARYRLSGTKPKAPLMIQHLPATKKLDHFVRVYEQLKDNIHEVNLVQDSQTGRLYAKPKLQVPSGHHQAVNPDALVDLGLTAWGFSTEDHVVEGIETIDWNKHFVLGAQFHPEVSTRLRKPLFDRLAYAATLFAEKNG